MSFNKFKEWKVDIQNMYIVRLFRKEVPVCTAETTGTEIRLFSSLEKTENWLKANGFYRGRRDFSQYDENNSEWIRKDDTWQKYINVEISALPVDCDTPSSLLAEQEKLRFS